MRALRMPLSGALSLVIVALGACGGDKQSAAVPDTAATSAAAPPMADTATSAVAADSGAMPKGDPSMAKGDTMIPRDTATTGQTGAAPAAEPRERKVASAPTKRAKRAEVAEAKEAHLEAAKKQAAAPAQPAEPAAAAPSQEPTAQAGSIRDEYHQAPRDTVNQVVYDGWKQYNLNCARCHGEDVLGTTIAPHLLLSLKANGPVNTKELFVQTVCAGRVEKGMPSWCALGMEPAKIEAMYAYVKARSDGKMGPGRPAVKAGA